jgi:hypothetical protein
MREREGINAAAMVMTREQQRRNAVAWHKCAGVFLLANAYKAS